MTLSPLAARIMAWGLLANVCWALTAFVAFPLVGQISRDKDAISTSRDLLARYQRLQIDIPAIQAELQQLRTKKESSRYFLSSASPALAAAELQNTLRELVSKSGATMRSSKSARTTVENGFDSIGLELELTASTPELVALLRAIARAEPVILIERLLAQVPESGMPALASDRQPAISVSLRLVSYGRRPQESVKS
jgi:general secretion pathway protein M